MIFPILSTLIILPLFGALVISLIHGEEKIISNNAKNVALLITSVCFFLSLYLLGAFEHRYAGIQFEETYSWISSMESTMHFGIDGLSIYFVVLTNFLLPLCVLFSWNVTKIRVKAYFISFLFLQSMINAFFVTLNLFAFYIFFEVVLIPLFFIIGIWGGENRIYASFKMFLYTFFGSLFFLLVIVKIYIDTGESDMLILQNYDWPHELEKMLFIGSFIAFAVKIPMIPFHTWLPIAHTQAPTTGSVILAGVLLKMGGYGILRVCLPLFPNAAIEYAPIILGLSLIAIIYTSLIALVQKDIKKLIAYSSIAHMGFVTLGIFSFTPQGVSGAVVQMISHGVISAALFFSVGVLYDRFHTRDIKKYGGLYEKMPKFGSLFLVFILASAGVPGTVGFIGEISILIGSFQVTPHIAFIGSLGLVLSATYGLWLYKRLFHGKLTTHLVFSSDQSLDLNNNEKFVLGILGIVIIYFGIQGRYLLGLINPSTQKIVYSLPNKKFVAEKYKTKIDAYADFVRHPRKGIVK